MFGRDSLYFLHKNDHRTIVAGDLDQVRHADLPAEWRQIGPEEIAAKLAQYPDALTPPTDDWPHLYIRERRVPREYLPVLAGVLLLSFVLVGANFRGARALDGHFFFPEGAGFLLLETKSVTEFALLVGSTWQVNSAVFVVILLMILLANLLVLNFITRLNVPTCYLLSGSCACWRRTFGHVGHWASGHWDLSVTPCWPGRLTWECRFSWRG